MFLNAKLRKKPFGCYSSSSISGSYVVQTVALAEWYWRRHIRFVTDKHLVIVLFPQSTHEGNSEFLRREQSVPMGGTGSSLRGNCGEKLSGQVKETSLMRGNSRRMTGS